MKRTLHILALAVVLGAVGTWLATGANRGWTKTTKPNGTLDEVTGIVDQTPVKSFQPGVDFLGAAFGGGALLAGASFFFRKPKTNQPTKQ
jgi:hypothetical protein